MNTDIHRLQAYPFERLTQLFADVVPNPAYSPIHLGLGEPKHATPDVVLAAISANLQGLANYPATQGSAPLRQAIAHWLDRRYGTAIDANTQVLPVNGSREALFAFAQCIFDRTADRPWVVSPNPFYQIYEGAALLAGGTPYFAPMLAERNFAVDWDAVPQGVWAQCQLLFVCSPGNPTGAVMPMSEWQRLFALSERFGFVIASDECYSEIYHTATPPLGALQAALACGVPDFGRLVVFSSLSKRSNVPGMRSGFVAGNAGLLRQFLTYRTYHGSAMSPVFQAASTAAWNDEAHVEHNRTLYREKFDRITPMLAQVLDVQLPDAGFYLWAGVSGPDTDFARELLRQYNVTVLPGSYLAREVGGINPGSGRVRLALVADLGQCLQAAQRIVQFTRDNAAVPLPTPNSH